MVLGLAAAVIASLLFGQDNSKMPNNEKRLKR
jgi:hypothetical protein